MRSLKDFNTRQLNKWVRQQREKQRQTKRGKSTKVRAKKMSKDVGFDLYYMIDRDDIKIAKRERGGIRNV